MAAKRVCVLGSGNWGSVSGKLVATNAARLVEFETEVRMWVFEETLEDGSLLSEAINCGHENVKYLPGVTLPDNLVAVTDAVATVDDCTHLVFNLPHQFLPGLLRKLEGKVRPDAQAISLIKGFDVDDNGIVLLSQMISDALGIPCSSLMGANIANEVAAEQFSETTIGCADPQVGTTWQTLFEQPYFHVQVLDDVHGVELCGAIKNVVALAAGFCDGLGVGNNSKAAIIRIGLAEMQAFTAAFFEGAGSTQTYLSSCGVADLITTCYGGRNRACAEEYARCDGAKDWETIEKELLNGQKLQGTLTSIEVTKAIRKARLEDAFQLFEAVHRICFEGVPVASFFSLLTPTSLSGSPSSRL